jgi:hypothetical protein
VSDQTGSAVSWRRGGSELQRCGLEWCRRGGTACRKQQIRATMGVEWLSIGAADRSHDDAEAQWVEVEATTRRRGGSESRRQRGGSEARGIASGGDLEVRSVWTPAVIDLNPYYGSSFGKMVDSSATVIRLRPVRRFERMRGRAQVLVAWFSPLVPGCILGDE